MANSDTALNQATAEVIQSERAGAKMTQEQLASETGIPLSTLRRVLKGTVDIDVADLGAIAVAISKHRRTPITPGDIVNSAVNLMGGQEALEREFGPRMSDVPSNVTPIGKRVQDMTPDEIEAIDRKVATRDPEMDTDEDFD